MTTSINLLQKKYRLTSAVKMQLADVFCYALLMVTMTTTWAYTEDQAQNLLSKKLEKRMSRRESSVIVDSIPIEKPFHRPKVIYRRISKKRVPLRPTYGPPKSKYGPPRTAKKPGKKYRGKITTKHPKVRSSKPPRYGVPKRQKKPVYGPPKINHQRPEHSEVLGFAEPPTGITGNAHNTRFQHDFQPHKYNNDFGVKPDNDYDVKHNNHEHDFSAPETVNEYQQHSGPDILKQSYSDLQIPKQSYGEPPVDSYGAPVKSSLHDLAYPTGPQYPEGPSHLGQEFNFGPSQSWQSFNDLNSDNNYAYSHNIHSITKPEVFSPFASAPEDDEQNLNSYSDIYNSRQVKEKKKKKASYYENVKTLNSWKGSTVKDDSLEEVVGGQYAEPPARYVPKFQPSAPMLNDGGFAPLRYPDPAEIPSATMSSYINYKNSNMAFSPQNLNDAFSIVDK